MSRKSRGFTLIELLIVVAIIGILAAIAVPNFLNARVRAKVAKAYADIRAIATANEMFALEHGNEYPPESEDYPFERSWESQGLFWLTTPVSYIGSLPLDPFTPAYQKEAEQHIGPRMYETGVGVRESKRVAYVIFTIGPDGAENGISSANPFVGPQGAGGQNNTYATTNGLTSSGDIYW